MHLYAVIKIMLLLLFLWLHIALTFKMKALISPAKDTVFIHKTIPSSNHSIWVRLRKGGKGEE
jgi:hypothetical protein